MTSREGREGIDFIYCALCNGHGEKGGDVCSACKGIGKVIVPNRWVYCALCNGHGEKEDNPCPACGGIGKKVW